MVHGGSRGIALLFHDHSTSKGRGVSIMPRLLSTPGKDPVPLYRRMGGPQGRSGQVRKILLPTGIRSLDCPARSKSLYRLNYLAHFASTRTQIYPDIHPLHGRCVIPNLFKLLKCNKKQLANSYCIPIWCLIPHF